MQPIVYGLEEEYGEDLTFDRVNANLEPGRTLLRTYGLRGHPSYVIVDPEGKSLWSATGLLSKDLLRTEIRQSLQ
jgi:hypothetical protein